MRVWDVSPGYLNRQSLLGEHRELHGLHSILINHKTGYARHPETRRWVGCRSALARRHAALVVEMRLRGYTDRTPIVERMQRVRWPDRFVTEPAAQYALLRSKYRDREAGRIPLPKSAQDLWAQHKYSVMARDQALYRVIGRRIAGTRSRLELSSLAEELIQVLRTDPPVGALVNALEHMWGYVSKAATADDRRIAMTSAADLLFKTRELAFRSNATYLVASTALGELAMFTDRENL